MLRTSKQKGLLFKMKKFFTSSDEWEDEEEDLPEVNILESFQFSCFIQLRQCILLDLMLEPSLMDKILDHLDVWSISKLEECCHLMRNLVVHNKMYRRRVKRIVCARSKDDWIQEDWEDEGDTPDQNSRYYKSKLYGYECR